MTDAPFEPPLDRSLPPELAPPPALRAATLAAVARARRRRTWMRVGRLAVAAMLLAIVGTSMTPRRKHASDVPGGASILLAAERAKPAFEALDRAEQELRAALAATPADADLGAALSALQQQRERLHRQVREAAS